MRHRLSGRKLSRDNEHRLAMKRNLVSSLFEHERVSTTLEKAKEVKSFAEKLITLGKKGDLASRRRAISLLGNRDIISYDEDRAVKKGTVVGKLFSEIAPRYLDRPGGYTRIIRLAMNRLGDNAKVVLLQLVGKDEGESGKTGKSSNKRMRRAKAFAEMKAEGQDAEDSGAQGGEVEDKTEESARQKEGKEGPDKE